MAFYAAAQHDAEQLLAYRTLSPHLITHLSSQFLRPDGGATNEWPTSLLPPMWVNGDELRWRKDLTDAGGTALLIATGVACAIDDVMTQTGPLKRRHLPSMIFEPGHEFLRDEIENGVHRHTGLTVTF